MDADGGFLFLPLLVQGEQRSKGAEEQGSGGESPLHPSTSAPPQSPPSLALSKDVEPASVQPGEVLTYTVGVTNASELPLRGVVLSDTLPAGLVYCGG